MRNTHETLREMRGQYEAIPVPGCLQERLEQTMGQARRGNVTVLWGRYFLRTVLVAALALAVATNVSAQAARALAQVPIIGAFTKLVTFRNYHDAQGGLEADIETPHVTGLDNEALEQALNERFDAYGDLLIRQYKEDLQTMEGGHKGVYSTYDVPVETERQLTVALYTVVTQASGQQINRYYTVDKQQGKIVELKDLFLPGADYVAAISEQIQTQMRQQMAQDEGILYFLGAEEGGFSRIKADQPFYVNKDGALTIAFDEYDVAPGYMGAVTFEIPTQALQAIVSPGSLLSPAFLTK